MRLLVDNAVVTEFPGLEDNVSRLRPSWEFQSFKAGLGASNVLESLVTHRPDAVILDAKWLDVGAPIFMSLLKRSGLNNSKSLISLPHVDNVSKILAAHNGFFDYIWEKESNTALLEKLERNLEGKSDLDKDELWQTIKRPIVDTISEPIAESDTDKAIIELLRIGISDNEIADALFLSRQTIRNRVSAMLQRDGFTNRTQLAWAYSNQVTIERAAEKIFGV